LENQVRAIVRYAIGLDVELGVSLAGGFRPDLYLPKLGRAYNLDPVATHISRVSSDRRKAEELNQHLTFRRARQHGLPPTGIWDIYLKPETAGPAAFASSILQDLHLAGVPTLDLMARPIPDLLRESAREFAAPVHVKTIGRERRDLVAQVVRCLDEEGVVLADQTMYAAEKKRFR
jgi:hypothetical protein